MVGTFFETQCSVATAQCHVRMGVFFDELVDYVRLRRGNE